MKKILCLLIIPLWLIACEKENSEQQIAAQTDQTVFMYMPWSSNLVPYFQNNIADFEKAISHNILKNDRLIIFFAQSPTTATLFEITYNNGAAIRRTIKNYPTAAFTSAEGITALINEVKTFAPANRYSMIVSCHGMGWLPVQNIKSRVEQKDYWQYEGVPLTRYFGGLTSEYQMDITTFAHGIASSGTKMEYILFDDCYMSSIEVAYDLKDVTNHLIASPTEVMAYGFPYANIGQYLFGEVDYYQICSGFVAFYQQYDIMPCGTIGVTVCSELDNLALLMKDINARYVFDKSQVNTIQRLDGYNPVIFFDYRDYVSKLCLDDELLHQFDTQFEKTVIYGMATESYYSMSKGQIYLNTYSGITTSDPSLNFRVLAKTSTAWHIATH